ncbi:hypothetical protein LTR84_005854 [Exophiala bonariae]|uniref:Efflux pump dotC n=1 Tax=Exophiala bonariae TaxID=1690606 RepID=A0AAV9N5G4_9EURO|nr:hypothetical protein LTR84_005854 [Exophiala bonariae]
MTMRSHVGHLTTSNPSETTLTPYNNEPPRDKPAADMENSAARMSVGRTVIVMLSLSLALFLSALDITIIATALPTIATHFEASSADYTWVGSSYLIAAAAATPLWGAFSNIWGRKPLLLLANIIFIAGSLVAALSHDIRMLIGGRIVQGVGGGGLLALVNICVSDLFSLRDRPKYYGIFGMVWAVAGGVGPIIGGAFTEKLSWRWCFYINLPLDGVSLISLTFFLKLDTPRTKIWDGMKAIDWSGVVLIIGAVIMFLLGIESGGNSHPWTSAYTLCLIIFGVFAFSLFLFNEAKLAKYPTIPIRLFKIRSNLGAYGVILIHGIVFISASYYLPLYFQTVLGTSSLMSGVYLLPFVLSLSLATIICGGLIKKTGRFREPIWLGVALMTLGYGLLINLGSTTNWPRLIIYQMIVGFGSGLNIQSPLIALQSHTKRHDVAIATSTYGFIRTLATGISIVIGGTIAQSELTKKRAMLQERLGPEHTSQVLGAGFGTNVHFIQQLPSGQREFVNEAYTQSLRTMWIFYTALSAVAIIPSLLIKKATLSTEHEIVKTGVEEQERVRQEELREKEEKKAGASRIGIK